MDTIYLRVLRDGDTTVYEFDTYAEAREFYDRLPYPEFTAVRMYAGGRLV